MSHPPSTPSPQPYWSTHSTNAAPSIKEVLQHLSSINPSPCASVTPEELRVPSPPQPALTLPVTLEEVVAKSPASQCDSLMESDSKPSSLDSTCSTASYTLQPRLPITYNETALSCLQGKPQVRTLNFLCIPLPA